MAWRIVKQPNGKYARFSEVVDDFTAYDMTREEAYAECMETFMDEAKRNAEMKVSNADADIARYRYMDAIDIIARVHGVAAAKERMIQLEGKDGKASRD